MENGEVPQVNGDESSGVESDALVIDEQASNPYFSESLFELSQQHQKKRKQKKYAQYLGLQPSVQFKCSRCARAGFESLGALNDHLADCTDTAPLPEATQCSSTLKLTRKVFLCSACGTYYENWNLYVHMLEVHKRFLCLYCLGMFSVLDDLCAHIQSKHNFEPGHKSSPSDFFGAYSEPCYIVCCECGKLFNEQDNFFYHTCASKKAPSKSKPKSKQIKPKEHVTAESANAQTQHKDSDTEPEFKGFSPSDKSDFLEFCAEFFSPKAGESQGDSKDRNEDLPPQAEEEDEEYDEEEEYDDEDDCDGNNSEVEAVKEEPIETRKVPKLSLKLKPGSFPEIESVPSNDDSQVKNVEQVESDTEPNMVIDSDDPNPGQEESESETKTEQPSIPQLANELPLTNGDLDTSEQQLQIAGTDIPIIELNELEQPLDKYDIVLLLKKCLNATAPNCIYCNHVRKIAVNGKQLGLHAIAEHRYSAVVSSITAEELIPESFVVRIRDCLVDLEEIWLNLDGEETVKLAQNFECFQCRFTTTIHKELYLHNRKLHAKNLLLCIMCKLNFYSYSELICHLCPGIYILDNDVKFRCYLCVDEELPSAFRLMVHLRKRHNVCDVCLEMCHNQYKLSNHVWKHKLHHYCYRCCIAYRNKPDITRHLFWKHGTESVLCKKCLQKKWPHVYHFCVPPLHFQCNECNLQFTRAVALKVHKRIHANETKHKCTFINAADGKECTEMFISKKLRTKHELKHQEPDEVIIPEPAVIQHKEEIIQEERIDEEKPSKPKVDVYDLPALNLSESSDSEDETKIETVIDKNEHSEEVEDFVNSNEEEKVVLENIWDDFKNYQANKEKFDLLINDKIEDCVEMEELLTEETALRDHDYCANPNKKDITFTEVKPDLTQSVDHDYCSTPKQDEHKPEQAEPKKASSSSSNDSDSSSCSCGSNCSCSSSSSSSSTSDSSDSDSSTEEGRKRQQLRRDRRRQKKTKQPDAEVGKVELPEQQQQQQQIIHESDLETTESETDEEFYDKQPQKLAKKILEEKRNQLLAGIDLNGQLDSRPTTPHLPPSEELKTSKKKSKSKKKKKKKKLRKQQKLKQPPYYQYYQPPQPPIAPIILSRNSPKTPPIQECSQHPDDVNVRLSKRRRVPNKFYGYSSEEDEPKWRKTEFIPPLTIKTSPLLPTSQPLPKIQPFSIRLPPPPVQPIQKRLPPIKVAGNGGGIESGGESNDSSTEGRVLGVDPNALYCYCKCPYDEVSEMIGCDSRDCTIEWFHFECVGIMVPPKGHWYCPECRKKRQQKRELLKMKANVT